MYCVKNKQRNKRCETRAAELICRIMNSGCSLKATYKRIL